MTGWRSVAYVESPLQLVSTLEAHASGLLGSNTDVVIRDAQQQYRSTVEYLDALGLPQGIRLYGSRDTRYLSGHTAPKGRFTHVLGDPLSGQQQSLLLRRNALGDIVIVDDGMSTLGVLEDLAANRPLVRPTSATSPARKALGKATTHVLRKSAFAGHVTLFTALPLTEHSMHCAETLDITLRAHTFPWVGTQPADESLVHTDHIIVGSALAADGYIHREDYLAWVAQAAGDTAATYIPHRRQDPDLLGHIAELKDITVASGLPLAEIALRHLGTSQHVYSLPSTTLLTLHRQFAQRGVTVHSQDIPPHWWTDSTPPLLREQLLRPLDLLRIAQ
ncbi:hypothetical protein [Jonesia quinghaiensis]|uniref:hypothetical protein n=1 Tax=Jonesia quinghaiensis TaxID=262806 RepID=UPI00048B11D5|nr:hypothetical protein [Jonesia quinghaiensis]